MRQSVRSLHACMRSGSTRKTGIQPSEAVDRFLADPRNHPNDLLGTCSWGQELTAFGAAMTWDWLSYPQFQAMMARGADLTAPTFHHTWALFSLAYNQEFLLLLARDNGLPMMANTDGWTLFHEIAKTSGTMDNMFRRCPQLIDLVPTAITRDGQSPLTVYLHNLRSGSSWHDLTVVRRLCERCGVSDRDTAEALKLGHFEALKLLAEFGADLNAGLRAAA